MLIHLFHLVVIPNKDCMMLLKINVIEIMRDLMLLSNIYHLKEDIAEAKIQYNLRKKLLEQLKSGC